jgi:hypothetical protein
MPPNRVVVLVPAANTLPVDNTAQRRATACLYFYIALGKSRSGRGHHHFSFSPCSAATHARGGIMLFEKPLLLRKSNERPSRLTHSLGLMMGKNTAPAAVSTAIFKLQRT